MDNYRIISGEEVTKENIAEALELDKLVYQDEFIVDIERCFAWFEANNQIYIMIYDETAKKIVSYINLSPVTEEYYNKIRSGQFIDTLLPSDAIVAYDFPDLYFLYFSSIVIHPDYQNTGIFKLLFDSIVKKIIELGENDIFFKKMVADAVTERGEKFCKLFGMKKLKNSEHASSIYEVNLIPPEFRVSSKATQELKEFYTQYARAMNLEKNNNNITETNTPLALEADDALTSSQRFDVFLSFKNSDKNGSATYECKMAAELYDALMRRGINTFFSKTTLEIIGAAKYKQVIDDALDQCNVLIAIGTSTDNINSQWVKYEWDSFSNDILSGIKPNGSVFSYIDKITPHMLPRTLRQSQVFERNSSSLEEICNFVENALGPNRQAILPNSAPSVEKNAVKSKIAPPTTLEDIYSVSKKFFKRSFRSILGHSRTSMLEEFTRKYSDLFSIVSHVKKNTETIDFDGKLIEFLLNAIYSSERENIIKIVGNNGSEKNALSQILFLNVYVTAKTCDNIVPFYINLPFYEKQSYDSSEKIQAQIDKQLSRDLEPFIRYSQSNPNVKPIIFIDGIRDFVFSKTIIEHILAEKLSQIHNLVKVVSVDTNLTINKKRQKKVIALAPSNFEYIVKVSPVDLVDDDICSRFYDAFNRIYGIDASMIHEKMKQMSFYEIDAYILRLSAQILLDNLHNDNFTISDLYEAMCLEVFNGDRETLLLAAKTAYDFAYNEVEFEDVDVFSAKHWTIIKRHKSFVEFLISYYYIYNLVEFDGKWDVDFFEQVLPKEITRFITPRLNDAFFNEEKIIKLCKAHYSDMGILGKSEMTFWLGRLKNAKLSSEATTLLKQYYDEIRSSIQEKEEKRLYTSQSERKADLFLLRGITVSLIYKGMDDISSSYIVMMLDQDLPNVINRGFHLEYYGDKPYIPNRDMLDFEDDVRVGEKALKRLRKNILQHFSSNIGTPILELDLFTMCSLIQNRIGDNVLAVSFNILPYVKQCLTFLETYYGRIKHVNNAKIFAYFGMVHDDFQKFVDEPKPLAMQSEMLNTYSNAKGVKRTGWVDLQIPDPESIVEHMYATWLMGMLNLPEVYYVDGYNKNKILNMIMIHDLGETITGDIPKPQKKGHPEFDNNEDRVMRSFLLKGTYPGMMNLREYYSLWDEWFHQESFNARVAKDLDCLQAIYQFCVYYLEHPSNFSDQKAVNWLGEYQDLKTEIGVELFGRLIRQNPRFYAIFDKFPNI